MLITTPPPFSTISRPAACRRRNVPCRLTSMTWRHCSGLRRRRLPPSLTPAALTSTSGGQRECGEERLHLLRHGDVDRSLGAGPVGHDDVVAVLPERCDARGPDPRVPAGHDDEPGRTQRSASLFDSHEADPGRRTGPCGRRASHAAGSYAAHFASTQATLGCAHRSHLSGFEQRPYSARSASATRSWAACRAGNSAITPSTARAAGIRTTSTMPAIGPT